MVEFKAPEPEPEVKRAPYEPTAIAVPLARSSAPRALSGVAANIVDVRLGQIASVDPLYPPQIIRTLEVLAVAHEGMSAVVRLLQANANRGHSVVVDVPPERTALAARAEAEINNWRERIYPGGGVEGLIGALLAQVAVGGATSAESVVAANRKGVERVVLVPLPDIEFLATNPETFDFEPHQRWGGKGLVRLDPRTYTYAAWRRHGGNPYAVPPFMAAINSVIRQQDALGNLGAVLKKLGWLGVVALQVPLREVDKNSGKDDREWMRSRQAYLAQLSANLAGNLREGIALFDEGMTLDLQAGAAMNAAGARDIFELELTIFCIACGIDPALLGISSAKSESWVGQARTQFQDMTEGAQRIVGYTLNRSLDLHLQLAEAGVRAWVEFVAAPSVRPFEEAQARALEQEKAIERARVGMVELDTAAKELGYDAWANPELINATAQSSSPFASLGFRRPERLRFRHDAMRGRYVHERPMLTLASKPRHRARSRFAALPQDATIQRILDRFLARYAGRIAPFADEMRAKVMADWRAAILAAPEGTWEDPDEFGRWSLNELQKSFGEHWREFGEDDVLERVTPVHEEAAKAWSNEDRATWADGQIPDAAKDAGLTTEDVSALAQGDVYHVSIYLEGMSSQERLNLQQLIAQEFDAAGGDVTDPDKLDEMLTRFERSEGLLLRRRDHGREGGEASETDEEARERMGPRLKRIVETSLMRSRNVTALRAMDAALVGEMEWVAVGSNTCPTCSANAGKTYSVKAAIEHLDWFLSLSPEEQEAALTEQRGLEPDERKPDLPAHPHCVCRWEAVL